MKVCFVIYHSYEPGDETVLWLEIDRVPAQGEMISCAGREYRAQRVTTSLPTGTVAVYAR